jgi:WD40 repeat protein
MDGTLIVSGSGDCTCRIWDVATGECLHIIGSDVASKESGLTSVAVSPDGKYFASVRFIKL